MGKGGWTRIDVATAVPGPPPAMWVDAEVIGTKHVGHAQHWAEHHPESKLLVLRSSIPVRSSHRQPRQAASKRSVDWWRDNLSFVTLTPGYMHPTWSWKSDYSPFDSSNATHADDESIKDMTEVGAAGEDSGTDPQHSSAPNTQEIT